MLIKTKTAEGLRCSIGLLILACGLNLPARAQTVPATPPMGWNSWNHFACKVSDAVVRAAADAIASNGMKDAGYVYVNIDDCWQGERDAQGVIHPNSKFPDMKALAAYVHSKGLKIGIYSSPGPKTCAGYAGSYKHEEQDAMQYAAWDIDYLKYDWCSASRVYKPEEISAVYKKMHDALVKTGRPIVFSMCQYGLKAVWHWGASVGGNLWRTTDDISDNYQSMYFNAHSEDGIEKYAGPGHWNDPDMLEVGNGHMSHDEYITHMSLWCILAAPLLAGNDLAKMTPETSAILTNSEAIAVDQDPKGVQGHWVSHDGPYEILAKPLSDGSTAVLLMNSGEDTERMTLTLKDIGVFKPADIRDLWAKKDLGKFKGTFSAEVPKHGAVLVKVH
ncbi:MAG TPA: glycoside hydrolase family 27 protein [Terriglobia bacterium]|nr:glycoside hydrolase family 27 protein [Terriglobia bacterium]